MGKILAVRSLAVRAWLGLAAALAGCGRAADREGAPPPPQSGTVVVGGAPIFYERAGSGPPVVLIHGGNLDRRMWDAQFSVLAKTHHVIRYDVRGFGKSGRADAPYQSHEDLAALLDSLGQSKVSLVGLSLGGRIAIDFALRYPARVDRLVLAGPGLSGWRDWAATDTVWRDSLAAAARAGDSIGMTRAWLESDYMKPAMENPDLAPTLRKLSTENASSWMDAIRYQGDAEKEADPPAKDRVSEIRAPTLIIFGDRDSPPILRIVAWLEARIPGVRVEVLRGAGHMVNMEQPEAFNRLLREFLDFS